MESNLDLILINHNIIYVIINFFIFLYICLYSLYYF